MIKMKSISPPYVNIFTPDGMVWSMNEYEFHDLRVKIKDVGAEGFKVNYINEFGCSYIIDIDSDGRLSEWPDGLFDQIDKSLMKLI